MTTGYTFNRVKFTQDEETCILRSLRNWYHSNDPEWYPIISSIMKKYYDSDIKEAQEFQTR